MARTYLDDILASHRRRAILDTRNPHRRIEVPERPSFRLAILEHRSLGNAVIAEVKRASPSKGDLHPDLSPTSLANEYVAGGASAISVLTDTDHFKGSVKDLQTVRDAVQLPILRKDFTVSVNDVLDTAEMGASCVLLIVAALSRAELAEFLRVSRDVGIDALVEVHDEAEAELALSLGADTVGVNQRDLHSFEVDVERAERVASILPVSVVRVAESGFHTADAVRRAASAGFDAVLVGEAFVTSAQPEVRVREFVGHPIGGRT